MKRRIRQIALVAKELEPTAEQLCGVFGVEVGYRDPGVGAFGLENVVIPIGDQFLEVVSPKQEGTTAGRLLDRRGGDGGYMVIFQFDLPNLDGVKARMEELGVRIVWKTTLDDIASVHLHPRDIGGAIVSIDRTAVWGEWRWGGPDWRSKVRTDRVTAIRAAELEAKDPAAMAKRWGDACALGSPRADGDAQVLDVGEHALRFVPVSDRGEGVSGVDLAVCDKDAVLGAAREHGVADGDNVVICGTRFRLV